MTVVTCVRRVLHGELAEHEMANTARLRLRETLLSQPSCNQLNQGISFLGHSVRQAVESMVHLKDE